MLSKSLITTKEMRLDKLKNIHPGEILREDFMKPMGLSASAVARAIGSTPIAISEIARSKRTVGAEMALKLGRYFGVTHELWVNVQADYDLEVARDQSETRINRRVRPYSKPEPVAA